MLGNLKESREGPQPPHALVLWTGESAVSQSSEHSLQGLVPKPSSPDPKLKQFPSACCPPTMSWSEQQPGASLGS